jgi:tRNA A37 threonylcarbamoyladenosine modification protein TsaB
MFLFLDVVSSIPEFHLIKDKKIIVSIKITENNDEKLSDTIIPKYLKISKAYELNNKITHFILTTGPGSYTALRVGASFIAGLSQSLSLPVAIISTENIYKFLSISNSNSGIFFQSSNNQNFLTFKLDEKFVHKKIENKNFIYPKHITKLFYNNRCPEFNNSSIISTPFSLQEIILKNINNLEFKTNLIIKPIYISNNEILN